MRTQSPVIQDILLAQTAIIYIGYRQSEYSIITETSARLFKAVDILT
jgi:hypothetical protein